MTSQYLAGIGLKGELLVVHGMPPFDVLEAIWALLYAISRRFADAFLFAAFALQAKGYSPARAGWNSSFLQLTGIPSI